MHKNIMLVYCLIRDNKVTEKFIKFSQYDLGYGTINTLVTFISFYVHKKGKQFYSPIKLSQKEMSENTDVCEKKT